MSDEVEIFKEFGTYERHFNQMQNVCRGFASTWLLAVFGGFGYIIANKTPGVFEWKLTGSLLALSGITGIFLLWVLDVLVYHNLLLAVIDARKGLLAAINERKDLPQSWPPIIDFSKKTVAPWFGRFPKRMLPRARYAISQFYGIPATFLLLVAFILNFASTKNSVSPGFVIFVIWFWWAFASVSVFFMMTTTAGDGTS